MRQGLGSVPELRFVNECGAPVLLLDGEELVGAKQNRIINLTILVAAAFYLLARVLLVLPLGVTYAIWSGLGVAAVSAIGWVVYGQRLDTAAWVGIGLIVAGVMVLNLVSDTTA